MDKISFKAALVGLPNVGKSLTFNVLSNAAKAESANYPFCTIEPNKAIVSYMDERLYILQKKYNSVKIVPSRIEFIDIAGLVKGASEGKGLGNKFLSEIYTADCIIHVVRCFEDDDVLLHIDDYDSRAEQRPIDPVRDLHVIRNELIAKDLQMIQANKSAKVFRDKIKELNEIEHAILNNLSIPHTKIIPLLSTKPFFILCNGSEQKYIDEIKEYCNKNNCEYLAINMAELEQNIDTNENQQYINTVIEICRKSLNIITFFTAGPNEVHAWDIENGKTVYDAAGEIHTDIQKQFVTSEVIGWNETVKKLQQRGYVVQNGDQINIVTGNRKGK